MRAALEAEEEELRQASEHDVQIDLRIEAERAAMAIRRGVIFMSISIKDTLENPSLSRKAITISGSASPDKRQNP